jgi:hypothetical protein
MAGEFIMIFFKIPGYTEVLLDGRKGPDQRLGAHAQGNES